MEKPHASLMAALLLMTGWFFHTPDSSQQPATSGTQTERAQKTESQKTKAGTAEEEGPWKASCQYWSAQKKGGAADASAIKTECTSDPAQGWGLPENIGALVQKGVQAHAIVAMVPDPVHSHLALDFDRTLDALIGAAADNRYQASYSWLPWKPPSGEGDKAEPAASISEEPGLLGCDKRASSGETSIVLYLFLVAEMPGDGVDAGQLKRALTYELQLRSRLGQGFATDQKDRLRIIGPQYSGSAMSVTQTVDTVLQDAGVNGSSTQVKKVSMAGATETVLAYRILNRCLIDETTECNPDPARQYISFASARQGEGFASLLDQGGYKRAQSIYLQEDDTAFAAAFGREAPRQQMQAISFPRDISLLRNSYAEDQSSASAEGKLPAPYLHLTTRDEETQDTLPAFSRDKTPLSQEAQLMAISHALTQLHADFAYIAASNPMDILFLAKSLRRSNPDTRLVMEPDLLLQREGDDTAYIGSLSVTPYSLVWAARSSERPGQMRTFPTAQTEAYYNAASFTLGLMAHDASLKTDRHEGSPPVLYGYRGMGGGRAANLQTSPSLWLTAVGADGYYPIAILKTKSDLKPEHQARYQGKITVYPSHVWQTLCILVGLGCVLHLVALLSANYSSPQTCDLDIEENCMRHRRALYAQVGGAALFLMSAITAIPGAVFVARGTGLRLDLSDLVLGMLVLTFGLIAWSLAIWKTWRAVQWDAAALANLFRLTEKRLCAVLYWGTIPAVLALAVLWLGLCRQSLGENLGAFFSYRCLHPLSGISPLAPALLLLSAWFLWALMHTRRLRLTPRSRPQLPDENNLLQNESCATYCTALPDLFVSDNRISSGLLEDTSCLMISRQVLQRIFRAHRGRNMKVLDALLTLFLGGVAVAWILLCPIRSLDHLGIHWGPTRLYELFIGLLLVPLLVITMCAAARLFLVASSLRSQLLERLERMPLRQAFTRLKGYHWVSMLRESGQLERWRDMARSSEGIRQILNDPGLPAVCRTSGLAELKQTLEAQIAELERHMKALREDALQLAPRKPACQYMQEIEAKYAACSEKILCCILLPHWFKRRHGLIQSEVQEPKTKTEPNVVLLAEEFLALRYVALIRAILAQMRYLLMFITAGLVLMMLALNSYPFQPKQEIDWFITGFFLSFCAGILVVLAQMHRNPLLSRITDKAAHELGADFYLRVATFGALPLVTWLATLYPSIGSKLYSLLKPGLEFMK